MKRYVHSLRCIPPVRLHGHDGGARAPDAYSDRTPRPRHGCRSLHGFGLPRAAHVPVERRGLYRHFLHDDIISQCCGTDHFEGGMEPDLQGCSGVQQHGRGRDINVFPAGGSGGEYDTGVSFGRHLDHDDLLAAGGIRQQFTLLYRAERGAVRRYLQRTIGVEDADDLTADVFTTVWSRWSAIPVDVDKRRAWVFSVAHFKVRETIRSRRYRQGLQQRLIARQVDAPEPGPENGVLVLARVRSLLARLPRSERDALALVVFGDLSSAEAADAMRCSVSALTSRVSRGRRRLRDILAAEGGA